MARLKRFVVPGCAHHVLLKAMPGSVAFRDADDYRLFAQALRRSAIEQGVALHAYALLPEEVQLLVTPAQADGLGRMMQALSRFYVPAFNRRHARTGTLWLGRYRAAPVGGGADLLTCMLGIEQAPQRSTVVVASDHQWSSAAHHAGSRNDPTLTAAVPSESDYWRLGNTPFERDAAYVARLAQPLSPEELLRLDSGGPKGWALGSGEFLASLEGRTQRRVAPRAKGRRKANGPSVSN